MLKEYAEYKESQTVGVSKIPISWQVQHGFALFEENKVINKDGKQTLLLQFNYGEIVPKKIQDAENDDKGTYLKYSVIKPGYILINGLNLNYDFVSQRVAVTNYEGAITSAYLSFKCRNRENLDYIKYLLKGLDGIKLFHSLGSGLRQTLTSKEVLQMQLPIPPISEQNAIVKYLDFKTKQIDEFVSAKEKEIAKLEELRCTLINTAVSRGIDNKNFKPSGMDWLPVIPEKWESINPKGLFALRKQKALKTDRQLTASQHHGVIFQEDYMAITGNRVVVVMKDFDILKHVEAGDFVISMRSFQGGIEYSENSGSISSAYVMLKPNPKFVYPKYFKWLFKSNLYITALQGTSDLVRDGQALRYANFVKVRLIKVPIEEQKAIADYLDKKTFEIDTLISSIQKQITLVKELRTKLIADAVTGKIDVRDVEIPA